MGPDLSDRDRERFEALRGRLDGVARVDPEPSRRVTSPGPIDPMLATTFDGELDDLAEESWIVERKYDGTRISLQKFDGDVSLYTRRHVERSETLSELTAEAAATLPDGLVIDGEYTFLDPSGASRFVPIHTADDKVEAEDLTARYFVFDVLASDHTWCTREPLLKRRDRLRDVVPDGEWLEVAEYATGSFQNFYDDLVDRGEEGVIAKRRGSAYHRGSRSVHWKKVKAFTETDVLAVGYTPGEGRRADTFGALVMTDGDRYLGRVGSGFSDEDLQSLLSAMTPVETRPVPTDQVGMPYTPVEPFVIQVKYQEVTASHELRAPVFVRVRPDKPQGDVLPIDDG